MVAVHLCIHLHFRTTQASEWPRGLWVFFHARLFAREDYRPLVACSGIKFDASYADREAGGSGRVKQRAYGNVCVRTSASVCPYRTRAVSVALECNNWLESISPFHRVRLPHSIQLQSRMVILFERITLKWIRPISVETEGVCWRQKSDYA